VFLSAPHAAARWGLQGTRDTTPGLCKVVDCLPALHVAVALRWLACWHSSFAGTIDPGSEGCASHTRPGRPSDGWPDGALRSGRKGTAQLNVNGLAAQWIHAVSTNRLKAHCTQQLTLGSQPNVGMLCLMNGLGAHRITEGGLAILRSTSINALTLVVLLASLRSVTGARHGG
jgi:hypothetical protein